MLGFEASNPGSSRLEDDPVAGLPLVSASGVEAMATAGDVISVVDRVVLRAGVCVYSNLDVRRRVA